MKTISNLSATFRSLVHAIVIAGLALNTLASCDSRMEVTADLDAPIYPDYRDITIPVNIAPLNFLVRDSLCRDVRVYANGSLICESSDEAVTFDIDDWRKLLADNVGGKINVTLQVGQEKEWVEYRPFTWHVVGDSIDPYLTYRLIEPDYEVFSRLELQERCLEDFSTRNFCDHREVGNRCMNCHTYAASSPSLSMCYVRGEGGGAVLNRNGKLSLLDIKTDSMVSGSVYFGFHPDGRHIVFSSNKIIPAFHSSGSKRLEVYDTASDVYVADLQSHTILSSPLLTDTTRLETFPTFSPDGRWIYFCSSANTLMASPDTTTLQTQVQRLQYYLCRISFDADRHTFGSHIDTLTAALPSVCHPRISPDGRYLLYTQQAYGTFPIWHRESDLRLLDLHTMRVDSLAAVNSDMSDTYHSWSHTGRWFVFASKRDDGLYGKPYFSYVDRQGHAHKPFVMPQRHPTFYDNFLRSFNAPELGTGPLPFSAKDIKRLLQGKPETFR